MRDVIKSIQILPVEYDDSSFSVKFFLHDGPGQELFEKIHHAVQCELLTEQDPEAMFPSRHSAATFIVGDVLFALRDGEMVTDDRRGWYSLWVGEEEFLLVWDVEQGTWYVKADFQKIKRGDDAFDYTDYTGLPEDFWVEPAALIRRVFGVK